MSNKVPPRVFEYQIDTYTVSILWFLQTAARFIRHKRIMHESAPQKDKLLPRVMSS